MMATRSQSTTGPWLTLAWTLAGLALAAVLILAGLRWQLVSTATAVTAATADAARWSAARARAGTGEPVPPLAADAGGPAALLARATALARLGHDEEALADYRQVEAGKDPALRRLARINSANLHLRQAMAWIGSGDRDRALPLLELAKGLYRRLLAEDAGNADHADSIGIADGGDWDLRYNLERAIRLLPEEEPGDLEAPPMPEQSSRATSRTLGRPAGLP